MHRIILAALALACVCSPAMAAECAPAPSTASEWGWYLGFSLVTLFLLGVMVARDYRRAERERRMWSDYLRCWPACMACGLAMILLLSTGPAIAAEVATADTTSVTLSAAPWISLLQEIVITAVIPAVAAYAIQAIRKVYPWAALFLTQSRVEQMANAVTEYAINAVPGAVKEGKLSINVGSQVIAKAVQRAVDAAPAKALEAAGGQAGLAEIVFRKLNLEDGADEHNTLAPVVAQLPRASK